MMKVWIHAKGVIKHKKGCLCKIWFWGSLVPREWAWEWDYRQSSYCYVMCVCVCTYLKYALTLHPLNQLCTVTAAWYSTSRCLSASLHTRLPLNNQLKKQKPPQRSICQIAKEHDASLVICIFRYCCTHFHFTPINSLSQAIVFVLSW